MSDSFNSLISTWCFGDFVAVVNYHARSYYSHSTTIDLFRFITLALHNSLVFALVSRPRPTALTPLLLCRSEQPTPSDPPPPAQKKSPHIHATRPTHHPPRTTPPKASPGTLHHRLTSLRHRTGSMKTRQSEMECIDAVTFDTARQTPVDMPRSYVSLFSCKTLLLSTGVLTCSVF